MNASEERIVIAGGGMAGLSLALLLDQALPPELEIVVVEGAALPRSSQAAAAYHPSFDARSTALSYSTARIYRELGIWERLRSGLAPIEAIHVSRRGHFGSTMLRASEQRWEALGWVVENPCLGRVLLAAVQDRPRIRMHCPARVCAAEPDGQRVTVLCNGEAPARLSADLLVIADGAASALREALGFFTRRRAYGQQAIIANLAFGQTVGGCAYERFTESGPLALLPLPASDNAEHRAALVWTLPPERAAALCAADEAEFSAALIDAFGYRLGRPSRIGDRHSYPLVLTEAMEQTRRGIVVMGNAAHSLHPVAGQGFNLALRDAASLTATLAQALARGAAPGDIAVLDDYLARQARDQSQTIVASDRLPELFASADPLLSLGRDLALSGLDLLPSARAFFVRQAAGVAALEAADA